MAVSIAGWKMPLPRKVSITWPYRKNVEKTLSGEGKPVPSWIEYSVLGVSLTQRVCTYGFVNIMSEAPSVHLILRESR